MAYHDAIEALRDLYLEDSWVLSVRNPSRERLVFDMDFVLTERHPLYVGPRPGEQYAYRRGTLNVVGEQVVYKPSGRLPARDATGNDDFGNIDSWQVADDGWSALAGEWGEARVLNALVSIEYALDG